MSAPTKHEHEFTALWSHFGRYGDETVHFHVCFDCNEMLVGDGRTCDGKKSTHRPQDPGAAGGGSPGEPR